MFAAIQHALAVNPDITAEELAAEFQALSGDRDALNEALLRASIVMADLEGGELTTEDIIQSTDAAIEEEIAKLEAK